MTQGISVYKAEQLIYHSVHDRNGDYLERESEPENFLILKEVDDCSPSRFYTSEMFNALVTDLDIIIREAEDKNDFEIANHLKEILVLCRFCLWNVGEYDLVISPFEFIPNEKYPSEMPSKHFKNISKAGMCCKL